MKPSLGFALWEYDLFPFCLGGTITEKLDDGRVETKEYGKGQYFRPIRITDVKSGEEIIRKLESLKDKYYKRQKELNSSFRKFAEEIVPFIKKG